MIRFKNVSKFYYSKGMWSLTDSKLNLEFEVGGIRCDLSESGKREHDSGSMFSLDSTKKGELYINEPRNQSLSQPADFEGTEKYISNILKGFNQSTAMPSIRTWVILRINGYKETESKKVSDYRAGGTRQLCKIVSKLSGQKRKFPSPERAGLPPWWWPDEPTETWTIANQRRIVQLLSEISKDKLIIVIFTTTISSRRLRNPNQDAWRKVVEDD